MASIPHSPTLDSVIEDMRACEQTRGLSVLEHGELVRARYVELVTALRAGRQPAGDWRLPDWIGHPDLIACQLPDHLVRDYQIFHDCGKPYCLQIDQDGRRHFPDHARVSESLWIALGGDRQVATLIGMDMDAHLLKGDQVAEFAERPEAATLLLTALAEIHANSAMFGGTGSTSFKIKWKHLDRRGKQVLAQRAALARAEN